MSAFWKDIFREISNTKGRFLSLLIITALGAAAVVGIQSTSIDMRNAADTAYKEHDLYDLQLKSSMGFDDDDIAALRGAAGVERVMPATVYDVFIEVEDVFHAARTYSLPDSMNTVGVLEGRLPENAAECVVESDLMRAGEYELGDKVTLSLDDIDDYFDVFDSDTFTIVGVVSSPLYVSKHERGNTALGDGSLGFYLYLHPDAYKLDVYTDVYLLMDGSREMNNLTDDYYAAADEWKSQTKLTGNSRVEAKMSALADAQREIDDGWKEYYDGERQFNEETSDGRQKLEDAKIKLDDAKAELEEGQKTLDKKIADGREEINKQSKTLTDSQTTLDARRSELEMGQIQLDETLKLLNEKLAQLQSMGPQGVSPELDASYEMVYASQRQLNAKQEELDSGRSVISAAQKELDEGAKQIYAAREILERERAKAQAEIDDGWTEYYKGLDEYNEGVETLTKEESDALSELEDAKLELLDAQKKLDDAPVPEWFYFTRKEGVAFDSYYQDTLRLQKIGYVFPMVFFLVAIMVSLTSMSRMVEEHRTQIGVYKALGYRPVGIMMKYFIYALSASLVGGVLGVFAGSTLFPLFITDAYGFLYHIPPIKTPIPPVIGALAVAAAVLSVVSVTLGTCAGSMKGTPALLMRPKPPAIGKRVLLERIPFIWRRLSFIGKVTARNIFRYKKRFIMTLAGVAGCSALLLTAFGLRDSIAGVSELQYGSIVKYDVRAYLKDITTAGQRESLDVLLPGSSLFIREEAVDAEGKNGGLSASLIVSELPEKLIDYIDLRSPKTGKPELLMSGGVLVTEKLARVMGVSAGDSFNVKISGGGTHTIALTGIVENYVTHYIYISPTVYSEMTGEEPHMNSVLFFEEDWQDIAGTLLKNDNVRGVSRTSGLLSHLGKSTNAMGIVTVVLIVLACALAFVVLFNLTNINISERLRELATIKVLGFYDMELAMYIYRENGMVTAIGIILGLVGGIFLHRFVLVSVEIDLLKFPIIINPLSYVYAIALSGLFAVIVNLVMNYRIMRIDMVESLKNVE